MDGSQRNNKVCVVLLCDDKFFHKMLYTLQQLKQTGYNKDICLVIGNDLIDSDKLENPLLKDVVVKHFPDINFSSEFLREFYSINRPKFWTTKIFQYHKLYLFDTFFKQWDYIFYIDSGTTIFSSIDPIIKTQQPGKLLAHSDSYPTYNWKLYNQFDTSKQDFIKNQNKYNFNVDYPQTTIMLYDTNIIDNNTFGDLYKLAETIPCSITNDQGILALYFTNVVKVWEQIKLQDDHYWYYDYLRRPFHQNKPLIMLKRINS